MILGYLAFQTLAKLGMCMDSNTAYEALHGVFPCLGAPGLFDFEICRRKDPKSSGSHEVGVWSSEVLVPIGKRQDVNLNLHVVFEMLLGNRVPIPAMIDGGFCCNLCGQPFELPDVCYFNLQAYEDRWHTSRPLSSDCCKKQVGTLNPQNVAARRYATVTASTARPYKPPPPKDSAEQPPHDVMETPKLTSRGNPVISTRWTYCLKHVVHDVEAL